MADVMTLMKEFWNRRAAKDPYAAVMTAKGHWEKEEYYEEGRRLTEELVLPYLRKRGIAHPQSLTALDIGCGTGRMTRWLSGLFGKTIGTDISEELILQARNDHRDREIEFLLTDGQHLTGIASGSIDVAFSFAVFQHIPQKTIVWENFREVYRVLTPGGLAKIEVRGEPGNPPGRVVWFWGGERRYVAFVLWRGWLPLLFSRAYSPLYGACFTERELRGQLRAMGFKSVVTYREGGRHLWVELEK
jgi:ubiquinone/menaquinone biosynthesis C-methylase UbiE